MPGNPGRVKNGVCFESFWLFFLSYKRRQTRTFQTCTPFSARILALTSSRLPSMPSKTFPPLLPIACTLSELKWAITSPEKGQAMQRYHEEQRARSNIYLLETFLAGALYRDSRESMRILTTFLGKKPQKSIMISINGRNT